MLDDRPRHLFGPSISGRMLTAAVAQFLLDRLGRARGSNEGGPQGQDPTAAGDARAQFTRKGRGREAAFLKRSSSFADHKAKDPLAELGQAAQPPFLIEGGHGNAAIKELDALYALFRFDALGLNAQGLTRKL